MKFKILAKYPELSIKLYTRLKNYSGHHYDNT